NEDDPNVKALDKRIRSNTAPIQTELEKEKAEVRAFALREFLADKPALVRDPAKIKELVQYYERIRTATERTREGVLLDLRKAYAVVFHENILKADDEQRASEAQANAAFSASAVDSGSTSYRNSGAKPKKRVLTAEDRKILAGWGLTEEEWQADADKYAQQ